MPNEFERDELTGRRLKLQQLEEQADREAQTIKHLKAYWWVLSIAVALLSAGFIAATYLGTLAKAQDLRQLSDGVDKSRSRLDVLETTEQFHDKAIRWQNDQLLNIARAVNAEHTPPPSPTPTPTPAPNPLK